MLVAEQPARLGGSVRIVFALVASFTVTALLIAWDLQSAGPMPDPESPTGYYIPRDLDDALVELDRILPSHEKLLMRLGSEEDMNRWHFGVGVWLRNNWGMWSGSRMSRFFNGLGIVQADDMSGIIFTSYWRSLHGIHVALEKQVAFYKRYWEAHRPPDDLECPGGGSARWETQTSLENPDGTWQVTFGARCSPEGPWWHFERGKGWYEADE